MVLLNLTYKYWLTCSRDVSQENTTHINHKDINQSPCRVFPSYLQFWIKKLLIYVHNHINSPLACSKFIYETTYLCTSYGFMRT